MQYITSRELSEKWGISQRRIVRLAMEGRINGAKLYGKSWMFPEDAQKPTDNRTKAGKIEKQKDHFRYPIFEFKDPASFNPPLNDEELTIKAAIEAFNACRFKKANKLLGDLSERTENRYIRITSLYCGCMIAVSLCDIKRFLEDYGKLKMELVEDFPYKAEMSEYIHEIDANLGQNHYYADGFHCHSAYTYHESFLPRLCNLSALCLLFSQKPVTSADLTAHEANCSFLEKTDNYFDLHALHIYLACAYTALDRKEDCRYHLHKAIELTEKYELFYSFAAIQYHYMPTTLKDVLMDFPEDLKKKIVKCNRRCHQCYVRFTNALQLNSIYKLLTNDDYIYIAFAVQGLTNKEIGTKMHLSATTIGKRYGKIYARLNVENKRELIELYRELT